MKRGWFGIHWQVGRWGKNSLAITMTAIVLATLPTLFKDQISPAINTILVAAIATIALTTLNFQTRPLDKFLRNIVATGSTIIVAWLALFHEPSIERFTIIHIVVDSIGIFLVSFVGHYLFAIPSLQKWVKNVCERVKSAILRR